MPTVHIESKRDEIANIVLMPGDPNRSEYIAKKYLKDTYSHQGCHNGLVRKIYTLFEEGSY